MAVNISVVIPLYNKASYVERALRSVHGQAQAVQEVIVVDDGSSDGGMAIVEAFEMPELIPISQENRGVSAARNLGIAMASSEFVAFLDADDIWLPHFMMEIQRLVAEFPDAGMFATAYSFRRDLKVSPARLGRVPNTRGYLKNYFAACRGYHLPITASSVVVRKSVLEEFGGFNPGMELGEDQLLWSSIGCRHKIAFSSKICAEYDLSDENSASKNLSLEIPPQVVRWQEETFRHQVPDDMRKALAKLVQRHYAVCVWRNLLEGNHARAKSLIWDRAMRVDLLWLLLASLSHLPKAIASLLVSYIKAIVR